MWSLRRVIPLRRAKSCLPLIVTRRTVSTAGWDGGSSRNDLNGEPNTYYDYLDSFWNRQWFGATENLVPVPESSPFAEAFVSCQQALGIDPAIAILLFGALCRLSTLYFSLYGERASERMRNAMRRLKAPHEAFQRVYYREGSTALDIQLAATALKGERRRIFTEEKTSNLQCLSSLLGTPIVLLGLFQTTALCENPKLDVGTSSFLWCMALTMPDPYAVFPIAFCCLTLMNFELSISKELKTGWMLNAIWGARLGCLCILPAVVHIRAGVALYFVGMSLVGLLQPLLLRSATFRQWFNLPTKQDVEKATAAADNDELHARMSVQFPYLTHLLSPESEENTGLLKDVAASHSSPRHAHTNTAGYAKGMNPLMREEPPRPTYGRYSSSSVTGEGVEATSSKKGADFASAGWKASRIEFSEEDFIPEVGNFDSSKRNGKK
ncbi:preprotein translocase subunit YidC [Trypanosoma grayi]|uniref:preprotein translocase subunit YidC n=1 Tax=Trypanosoma grayi TaxID=71804 RepID=UPI0004F4450E|nr:preprotein translocase subunit YidC [Trypanosoma grayi]KEG10825.1 preprotein translocase subunit YidC [Trypanosoma grayi]